MTNRLPHLLLITLLLFVTAPILAQPSAQTSAPNVAPPGQAPADSSAPTKQRPDGTLSPSSSSPSPRSSQRQQPSPSTPAAASPSQATPTDSTGATSGPRPRRAGGMAANTGRSANASSVSGVLAAFEKLLDGIRQADVNAVMDIYWQSPELVLFNNNGTVTRTWDQVEANRRSYYPNVKNVRLEVRDVNVRMLGRDAALVVCLWTQSQIFRNTPENATGRLTVVFSNTGGKWKAIHAHTSPDAPDPSRLLPSERKIAAPVSTVPGSE